MSIAEELTVKDTGQGKKAVVYRMVTDEHICPFGLKTVDLLKRKGFEVEDNWLTNRAETARACRLCRIRLTGHCGKLGNARGHLHTQICRVVHCIFHGYAGHAQIAGLGLVRQYVSRL